ncbi:Fc.00g030180.m01.CDS01 [Cosmosporella sp. VM-42]
MHYFALLTILSTLASRVVANDPLAQFGVSPVWPPLGGAVDTRDYIDERDIDERDIDERDIDRSCVTSVLTQLSPPSPSDTRLVDWAATSIGDDVAIPSCTISAPASLSSPYISYVNVLRTWLETVESKAKDIKTDCDADSFSLSFTAYCTSSITVLFTTSGGTKAVRSTTLEPLPVPTGDIQIGAASRSGRAVGVAVAVAVALGVALAL